MAIVKEAYAKINLSLDVIGKLENGYHEVCMIMQTIGLRDELSFDVIEVKEGEERIIFDSDITADNKDNLIYKAAALLMPKVDSSKGVKISLTKNIPMAAGMAGGSTDAAATLHGINELFNLQLTDDELCELGVKIGADVPYCIKGGTMLAEGIGEKLSPLRTIGSIDLVIAKPEAGVSTKYVYEHLDALPNPTHPDVKGMKEIIEKGEGNIAEKIASKLGNILECVTIPACPEVQKIKDILDTNGSLGSLMSGSGPTVFGVFPDKTSAEKAAKALRETEGCPAKDIFVTTTV